MSNLDEALGMLLDFIKATKSFVGDQAPKVAQEIIQYELWSNLLWFGFLLVLILVLSYIILIVLRIAREEEEFYTPAVILAAILIGVVVLDLNFLQGVIKTQASPRLVVIDYLQSKVKR